MKSKCLKEFQDIYDQKDDPKNKKAKELYQFYIDIAPTAYQLYEKWKSHPGFEGTGLRCILRDGRQIVDVPDGLVFPILASLSAFARKKNGRWQIDPPTLFKDSEIIHAAKAQYQNVAHSNPWNMGKNQAIYSSLFQITTRSSPPHDDFEIFYEITMKLCLRVRASRAPEMCELGGVAGRRSVQAATSPSHSASIGDSSVMEAAVFTESIIDVSSRKARAFTGSFEMAVISA